MISAVSSVWYLGVILELDAASLCEAHFAKYPLGEVAQAQAVGLAAQLYRTSFWSLEAIFQ